MSAPRPPRLAEALLRRLLRTPDREHILGDLEEEYSARRQEGSALGAALWYWGEVGRSVWPILRRTFRWSSTGGSYDPRRSGRPVRAAAFSPPDWIQDARQILRVFVRRPVFPLLVVLTLGAGIGIVTTTFAVIEGVLLQPLPLPDADRLVFFRHRRGEGIDPGPGGGRISPGAFVRYRDGSHLLESVFAFATGEATLTDGTPTKVQIGYPTPGLGKVVGLPPVVGRWNNEEDLKTERWVAVLSYTLWKQRYGGDRNVVGKTIRADGEPAEIIGVAPPEAEMIGGNVQVWVPLRQALDTWPFGGWSFNAVGRLRAGVTMDQLRAELGTLLKTVPEVYPRWERQWRYWYEDFKVRPAPRSLLDERVGSVRRWIWLLVGAAATVFLVGLANVGSLALARSLDADTDVAVRAALGGGRGGLARLFVVEAVLLSGCAAVAGLALSGLLLRGLPLAAEGIIPRIQDVSLDPAVLEGALALGGVSMVVLTLIPFLRLPRDLASTLRGAAQGGAWGMRRFQSGLLVTQVGLACALVVFGGLMGRSFWTLRTMDLGFPTEGLYAFELTFPTHRDDAADKHAFFMTLQERLEAIPGVTSVSASECIPLRCPIGRSPVVQVDERWLEEGEVEPLVWSTRFIPGYFETLGIPVRSGRDLTWADAWTPADGDSVGVVEGEGAWVQHVVINQQAAEAVFPEIDPLGHHFRVLISGDPAVVVGVVPDLVMGGLSVGGTPIDAMRYIPDPRFDGMNWVVRSELDRASLLSAVQDVVWAMDPTAPIEKLADYHSLIGEATRDRTLILLLAMVGATLSVFLGLVGVYGALAHDVRRRRRDLGIRNALGADAGELRAWVLRRATILVAVGLILGIALSAAAARILARVVYGVSTLDPGTYVAAAGLIFTLGLAAAYVPALRASRSDPLQALRAE